MVDIILLIMTTLMAVFGVHAYRHQMRLERRWLKSYALISDKFRSVETTVDHNFNVYAGVINKILEDSKLEIKISNDDETKKPIERRTY